MKSGETNIEWANRAIIRSSSHGSALCWSARGRRKQGTMQIGGLRIDPSSRDVLLAGRKIELSAKEFQLLCALASEPMRAFTKEELLRDVWGFKLMGTSRRSPMTCSVASVIRKE
jgi:DNA-binding response OmpR family regulator